jgi:hypothetical protein
MDESELITENLTLVNLENTSTDTPPEKKGKEIIVDEDHGINSESE